MGEEGISPKITTATIGGIIAYAFGLGAMTFGVDFYMKAIAVLLIAGSLGFGLWQWEALARWSVCQRALSVTVLVAVTFSVASHPLYAAWIAENKSPEDLRASFDFPTWMPTDGSPINVGVHLINDGSHADAIENISLVALQFSEAGGGVGLRTDVCDNWKVGLSAFSPQPPVNVSYMRMQPDVHSAAFISYPATLYSVNGQSTQPHSIIIEAGKTAEVIATFRVERFDPQRGNVWVICPSFKIVDGDGGLSGVTCRGTLRATTFYHGSPTGEIGGPYYAGPLRILPRTKGLDYSCPKI